MNFFTIRSSCPCCFVGCAATKAEALRGPRLMQAVKSAQATRSGHVRKRRGERIVQLDALEPPKRAMLERARTAYVEAGGELDELWEPFLQRFLIGVPYFVSRRFGLDMWGWAAGFGFFSLFATVGFGALCLFNCCGRVRIVQSVFRRRRDGEWQSVHRFLFRPVLLVIDASVRGESSGSSGPARSSR